MAKVDLKSAFRIIPVRKQDWELLGIHWRNQYYVDTCLPFGLRSAPYLFNQFADALEWILRNNYSLQWVIHYLDDYDVCMIYVCVHEIIHDLVASSMDNN